MHLYDSGVYTHAYTVGNVYYSPKYSSVLLNPQWEIWEIVCETTGSAIL